MKKILFLIFVSLVLFSIISNVSAIDNITVNADTEITVNVTVPVKEVQLNFTEKRLYYSITDFEDSKYYQEYKVGYTYNNTDISTNKYVSHTIDYGVKYYGDGEHTISFSKKNWDKTIFFNYTFIVKDSTVPIQNLTFLVNKTFTIHIENGKLIGKYSNTTLKEGNNLIKSSHIDITSGGRIDILNVYYMKPTPENITNETKDTLNPNVKIDILDNFISFSAPSEIYNEFNLWIKEINQGHSYDLNNKYGIINGIYVKNTQGEVVAFKDWNWNHLTFKLNGKTVTLNLNEYELLKQHKSLKKKVGIKKEKYVSKYKKVKKTIYTTKLLGKAYKSKLGALILCSLMGIKKTVSYFKHVDAKLKKKVMNNIKRMKKKGWKFYRTYNENDNGEYKVYGEFSKKKVVKKAVYKYKKMDNYMEFKFDKGRYVFKVDSDDNKYFYFKNFELV